MDIVFLIQDLLEILVIDKVDELLERETRNV